MKILIELSEKEYHAIIGWLTTYKNTVLKFVPEAYHQVSILIEQLTKKKKEVKNKLW